MKIFKSKIALSLPLISNQLKLKVVTKSTYFILDEEFYEENKSVNHNFKFLFDNFEFEISQEFIEENLEFFEEVSTLEYLNWKLNSDLSIMLDSLLRDYYEEISSINPHYDSFEIWSEKIMKQYMKFNYKEDLSLTEQIFKQPKVLDFKPNKNPFDFKCVKCQKYSSETSRTCTEYDCPLYVVLTNQGLKMKNIKLLE